MVYSILVYSAASTVARYFSKFPAPSSHCQKLSSEPAGMSELVVAAATTGAAASRTGGKGKGKEGGVRYHRLQSRFWFIVTWTML